MKSLLCASFLLLSSVSFAITDEEIFRNFQFSFVNPGARSTAMGNAFVALADDATAAEANPAGLTILKTPEVSLEFRHTRYDQDALNEINNVTAPQAIRIESFNNLDSLNRPSFFSVVYPFRGMTFAFSRQEAVRIQGSIDELLHFEVPVDGGDVVLIDAGALGSVDQSVVNWNFSAAKKIGRLSLGGSLRVSRLEWNTEVQNSFFSITAGRIDTFNTRIDDSATSLAYNFGAIYSPVSKLFLGAVYKKNARFEVTEIEAGDIATKRGPVTNVLKIPDTFALGVAVKPNNIITVSAEVVRIEYSDLVEGFEAGYNLATARYTNEDISYQVDNAYEFHLGTEFYVLLGSFPVALRNGYYRKPSNALVAANTSGVLPFDGIVLRTIFSETESENHITIGGGIAFYDFQIDFAVDSTKNSHNLVISTVYRF